MLGVRAELATHREHLLLVVQAELPLSMERDKELQLVVMVVTEVLQVHAARLRPSVAARPHQVLRARCLCRNFQQSLYECC